MANTIDRFLFEYVSGIVDKEYIDKICGYTETYYNLTYRYYHNCDHINSMLMKALAFHIPNERLAIAIVFHDIIYDVVNSIVGSYNELNSANKMIEWCVRENKLTADDIIEIYNLINATANHLEDFTYIKGYYTHDVDILMDLDLSGFAGTFEEAWTNTENVRKEYMIAYSETVVIKNNVKFLQALINKKNIYRTDLYHYLYEDTARKNIQMIIDKSKEYLKSISEYGKNEVY